MPRRSVIAAACIVLVVGIGDDASRPRAAAVPIAATGEAEPAVISCSPLGAVERGSDLRLARFLPTPAAATRLGGFSAGRFGPFDEATYGFNTVEIYLDPARPYEEGRETDHAYDVYVRLNGREPMWLKLAAGRNELVGSEGDSMERPVSLATGDGGLPLFLLSFKLDLPKFAGNHQVLLDFRPRHRRVPVFLECDEAINQGACLTADKMYEPSDALSCRWNSASGDFDCEEQTTRLTTWGAMRRSHTRYPLIAGPPVVDRTPALLDAVHRLAASQAAKSAFVEGWGTIEVLRAIDSARGRTILVGAPSEVPWTLHARFLLVTESAGKAAVSLVPELPLMPTPPREGESGGPPVAVPPPATPEWSVRFVTSVMRHDSSGPLILRVLADEADAGEERARAKAVYLVGIEDTDRGVQAQSVRVATDTADYEACGKGWLAATALSAARTADVPFGMELDVEPPRQVNVGGGVGDPEFLKDNEPGTIGEPRRRDCARTVTVSWQPSTGFRVQSHPVKPCGASPNPRWVVIDDAGNLSVGRSRKP